jgi:hypothetical protein
MSTSTRGEKVTALVSTLVAIAILAAGVTAQQSHKSSLNQLLQLESDLRLQLDLAYGHDRPLLKERRATVNEVLDRWSGSTQTASDYQRVTQWLKEAITASMPGATRPLPEVPLFDEESPLETSPESPLDAAPEPPRDEPRPQPRTEPAIDPPSPLSAGAPIQRVPTDRTTQTPAPIDSTGDLFRDPRAAPTGVDHRAEPTLAEPQTADSRAVVATEPLPAPTVASPDRLHTVSSPPDVQIDIAQLHARLNQHNLAVVALQRDLLGDRLAMNTSQLPRVVDRLDELTVQYDFLRLYYDSLTEAERSMVAPPRSPSHTARFLRQRLDMIVGRSGSDEGDFLSPFDAQQQPILQALDQRLLKLSETDSR